MLAGADEIERAVVAGDLLVGKHPILFPTLSKKGFYMTECPVCKTNIRDPNEECSCGYSFEKIEITNPTKLLSFYKKVKAEKNWIERIGLTRAVHEIQVKKYGEGSAGSLSSLNSIAYGRNIDSHIPGHQECIKSVCVYTI